MELALSKYIEKLLSRAKYEYDNSVKQWATWVDGLPGVYAQGQKVEEARQELASTLEEYILISIREGKLVPGFELSKKLHVKTH